MRKNGAYISASVCYARYGWEFQLFVDRQFRYSHRYDTRALAIAEATGYQRQLEADGWSRDVSTVGVRDY